MHKLNVIKVQMLLLVICSIHSLLLHGMLLENKCSNQKNIEQLMREKNMTIPEQVWWDQDFRSCAWVTVEQKPIRDAKTLECTLVTLIDSSIHKDIIVTSCSRNGYKYPGIGSEQRLFFDNNGGVVFYGIGDIYDWNRFNWENSFLEYSMNCNDEYICAKKCRFKNKRGECTYSFSGNLLHFTELVQSLLRSTSTKNSKPVLGIIIKKHMISGVFIPDNYKDYKKHPFGYDQDLSYDDLSDGLKDIIQKRYAEQQREKNNNISQEK